MMPTLQMRKENEGLWTIRITWPDGACEDIPGFPHEQDADDWITNKFPVWLEEQKKARASAS
jgi:hypothetical protein